MFIQQWGDVLTSSLQGLWFGFVAFVPKLIFALVIFIIGWAIGMVVSRALAQIINALKINKLFESIGAKDVLERAGFRLDVGKFIGEIAKWFIVLVFLMASLNILGLDQVNLFLREVVLGYLPPARASIATIPVKRICMNAGAMPSCDNTMIVTKIQIAHFATDPAIFAE
jgi:large-conductance mechanosensitive channel